MWNLIEPVLEHGLISVLIACIIFLVSRVLETLVGDEGGRRIHAIEAFGYTIVALLYMLHTLSILSIRIGRDIIEEARRRSTVAPGPQGGALDSLLRLVRGRRVGEGLAYDAEPRLRSGRGNDVTVSGDEA